jgi:hypothetical protein
MADYGWLPQIDMSAMTKLGQGLGNRYERNRIGGAMQGDEDLRTKAQRLLEMGRIDEARAVATMAETRRRTDIDAYEAQGRYAGGPQRKPMPAAVMRQRNEAMTNATGLGNTIKFLEEAEGLIGEDGQGIFDTAVAPYQTAMGTSLNVGGGLEKAEDWVNKTFGTNSNIVDPDKAVATSRFQQIMESESLKTLSRELKGPTAVQEVMTYKQILANPNKTNREKAIALKGMIRAIKNDLAAQGKSIENIDRAYGGLGATDATPDAGSADPEQLKAWAQEAIDQGADPEQVRQMLEEYGVE